MTRPTSLADRAIEQGYEPEDVRIGGVLTVAAASLLVLILIGLALWGMTKLFAESYPQAPVTRVEQSDIEPPPPRLQPAPKDDLAAFRAQEEALLNRWGWIDQSAGVAQIPIDRAMALLAERGWPQPDRPETVIPPRAAGAPDVPPRAEERSGPGAEPNKAPHMSPQEEGPAQAQPEGGFR